MGNGRIGLAVVGADTSFYLKGKRGLSESLPFDPLINVDTSDADAERASALDLIDGVAHRISCMRLHETKQNVKVSDRIYAHRTVASLLVQEIDISNPNAHPQVITLQRNGWHGASDIDEQALNVHTSLGTQEYNLYSGTMPRRNSQTAVQFVIAAPVFPNFVELRPKAQVRLMFYTVVHYQPSSRTATRKMLIDQVTATVKKVHSTQIKSKLPAIHRQTWNDLWTSGFGISYSKAEDALNGDLINATAYYVLSNSPSSNTNDDFFSVQEWQLKQKQNSLLDQTESCYDGHSTLQAETLWSRQIESVPDINRIVSLWLMTLEKQGCHALIDSGAEGTQQALLLSLASLQFTKHHVEFNQHPKELHRDYYIRRLRYGFPVRLNLTVRVNELDNRAMLYVAIDRNEDYRRQLYACDAGCLDSPVKLNTLYAAFPIKLTEPRTAILYVTADHDHISELKHTIHVKEISLAPAHEQHVIHMHRHGHGQISTITALFWALVVFMIVLFHVFLARLIYTEYWTGNLSTSVGYEKLKSVVE